MSSMVEKDRLQVLDDWRRKENTLNDQAFFAVLKLFSVLGSIQSGSHVLVLRDEVPEKFPNNFTPSSNNTRSNSNNAPLGLDRRPAHLKFGTPSQPASFSAVACLGSPSIDEEGGVVETVSASVNRSYAHWLDMPAREYSPTARAQLQHAPKRRVKDPLLRVRCPGGSSRLSLLILPSDVSQLLKPLTKKLRSLVVAGGTLTPLSLTSDPLFGPGNYIVKSFKHIVDVKKNLRLFTVSSSRYAISAKAMPLIRGVGGGSDNDSKREIEFTFTFKTSNKKDELVRAAMNLVFEAAMEVPHGLIVFFPSFMKQDEFWTAVRSVEGGAFFTALNKLKKVFIEEQAGKQQQKQYGQAATNGGGQRMSGDDLLVAYSNYVEGNAPNEGTPEPGNVAPPRTYRGALLSCVMNGKLAEGINFNDHLGRGVIVFGVPYASIKDAELAIQLGDLAIVQRRRQIEENKLKQPQHHRNHHQQHGTSSHTTKIQQLDNAQLSKAILSSEAVKEDGIVADMIFGSSAQDHSSSHLNAFVIRKDVNDIRAGLQLAMAMRAVNQAIGRCIRHKDDYATIFLCDSRYNVPVNTNSTRGTAGQFLPKWMEPAKIMCPGLGDLTNIILPNVQAFFEEKQQYNK